MNNDFNEKDNLNDKKEKSLLRDLITATQDIQKSAYDAKDAETKEIADL